MRNPDRKKEHDQPIEVDLGPLTVKGRGGLVSAVFVGMVVGIALTLFDIVEWQQPKFAIDPLINAACTNSSACPTPPRNVLVTDADTGAEIHPSIGAYFLKRSDRIIIMIGGAEGSKFDWVLQPVQGSGSLQPRTGNEALFTAPLDVDHDVPSLIKACQSAGGFRECLEVNILTSK